MEYELGIRIDKLVEDNDKIIKALAWIIQSLNDANIKPKDEVNNGITK